jgi:molybdate transport system substrate-binding protein
MGHSAIVLTAAACVLSFGCSSDDSSTPATEGSGDDRVSGEVVVFAAASLTDVFTDIATAFERAEPGVDVSLSFGGSSSLAVSVEEGAPADVLASANNELMQRLADADLLAGGARPFATNAMALAVPIDDDEVTSLRDFERGDLFLGACAAQVPCGQYADELFADADVDAQLDTRAPDVRAVVTLLLAGELDAGIVYTTDVAANADRLRAVPLDVETVAASYPIAVLAESPNSSAADRFVDFVLGDEARAILDEAGFGAP